MEISNFSIINPILRKNNNFLPNNLRALVVGKSYCGKSTLLYNLLLKPWLDYENLIVFGKSLHQNEYKIIKSGFDHGLSKEQIANLFNNQVSLAQAGVNPFDAIEKFTGPRENKITAKFFDDCTEIPDPSELDPCVKHLMVFDDCYLGKQNKSEAYYTRGRHSNCETIFLSQNYFRLPRQSIRENCNFIMLFKQDAKNVNHIYADHCTDLSREEFKNFCQEVWKTKHNFVTIDMTSSIENGRYRKNLNTFYIPDKLLTTDSK